MKKKSLMALMAALYLTTSFAFAQDQKVNSGDAPEQKTPDAGAVQNAALGYELVLLGDKNKSSTMLLAAAELLGGMKQSDRDSALEKEASETEEKGKSAHDMSFGAILDRAVEYATDKSKALVQAQVDDLRSGKGLVWDQGKDKESVNVGGVTYKILDHEVIKPGQSFTYRNLKFEGDKPASIVVIGDGDGDLDLWIHDGAGNKSLIDKDTDSSSRCVTEWNPKWTGPFTARVKNVGRISEEYIIIANW